MDQLEILETLKRVSNPESELDLKLQICAQEFQSLAFWINISTGEDASFSAIGLLAKAYGICVADLLHGEETQMNNVSLQAEHLSKVITAEENDEWLNR